MPSLRKSLDPADVILAHPGERCIAAVYNGFIREARDRSDCEALVLVHDDVEILDPNFRAKVITATADRNVGVVGVIGGSDLTSVEWYNARRRVGRVHESRFAIDFGLSRGDVDVVDGLLLVLAPRAFRLLEFDEVACPAYHGYDTDYCLSARSAGLRVVVAPIDVLHRTKGGYGDRDAFDKTAIKLGEKWSRFITPLSPVEQASERASRIYSRARRLARIPARLQREIVTRGRRLTPPPSEPLEVHEDQLPVCPVCDWTCQQAPPRQALLRCPSCGTGITWPPPKRDVTGSEIWTERYGRSRLERRPTWFREAQLRLEWLLLYRPSGCLLEIGCGTGEFIRVSEDAGFDAYGVEPSAWAAGHAKDLGIRVETGFVTDWRRRYPGMRLDVVTIWHVLEHVPEPWPFLNDVRDLLGAGGLLMMEIPNFDSSAASELGLQWDGAQPDDHFFHYTPDSLRRLLESCGFRVLSTLPMTRRLYSSGDSWRQERNEALLAGRIWPPLDLLRAVAVKPESDS